MQAILNGKHLRFCNWLQDIKSRQSVSDDRLDELEQEIHEIYLKYQQKREEVREAIQEYEAKQRAIKNEIKRSKKYTPVGYEIK